VNITPIKEGRYLYGWQAKNIKDDHSDEARFLYEVELHNGSKCTSGYQGIAFKTSKRSSSDILLEGDDLIQFIPKNIE